MSTITLYHGSPEIIQQPVFGKGKSYNDYGLGFYCTEHLELAKEWACTENTDGYANRYEINIDGLNVLNLTGHRSHGDCAGFAPSMQALTVARRAEPDLPSDDQYTILHWLALLMEHRQLRISTPVMKRGMAWLKEHFLIDITPYEMIIGYRADDSYFSFARAFINNEISLSQLSRAMRLGKLGEQYVLKSREAFDRIRFISYDVADNTVYYAKRKTRDDDARAAYRAELEHDDIDGLFMRDIIREEVQPDDPRLR